MKKIKKKKIKKLKSSKIIKNSKIKKKSKIIKKIRTKPRKSKIIKKIRTKPRKSKIIKKIRTKPNKNKLIFKKNKKLEFFQFNFVKKFDVKNFTLKLFEPIITSYKNFFQKIKDKKIKIQAKIQKEKIIKIDQERKKLEKERKEKEKKLKLNEQLRLQLKERALKEEIKMAKEREKDIKQFLRKEQAEIRKEQVQKQRQFLEELKIEKQIEKFQIREIKELENLEKISLKEEREDFVGLQARIDKLKDKYRAIRDEKIRERVQALGINIQEGDDRDRLLEKEKAYRIERHKIENCLESFYRSANSLVFQLNKRYITRNMSMFSCEDSRFVSGEIFIKWDENPDDEWLLLIYIKNNSPKDGVIIEDKTNPEKNVSHEFKINQIFKASDLMVDSLTQLLERKRTKKAS